MRIRRSISLLGVAATALAGVAFASGTASASSGGGCGITEYPGIVACVSASGGNVNYDAYIPTNCSTVSLTIYDDSKRRGDTVYPRCGHGHVGPFSVAGINGDNYHASVSINGQYNAWSFELHFSN